MTNPQDSLSLFRKSHSIGKYDIVIENELFSCRIFWAKVVGSETESLFTQYTRHTFYEIQYALEGRIVMQIEKNEQIQIEPSNFIIVPPDTSHQIVDGDYIGARFIMAFSLDIKDACLAEIPYDLSKPCPCHETAQMRRLIENIISKNYHEDPIRRKQISSYLECFILEVLEAVCPSATRILHQKTYNEKQMRISQIQQFISHYHGIGIRPADVAQKFNVCERHLNRIFVTETGETLKEAINRKKLAKIEELITTTALSFREISELCCFSDAYTMNKFFKRYNYIGLKEYRNFVNKEKS